MADNFRDHPGRPPVLAGPRDDDPGCASALARLTGAAVIDDLQLVETSDDYPTERPLSDPLYSAVMGTAGTGKTWKVRDEARRYDDAILCATSGIAAVNLGGTTINSLLWYYDLASLRTSYELGKLNMAVRKVAESRYTRIVIDEMSMMDGAQLDILCASFNDVNEARDKMGLRPIGMTLVGDFCQLPPVGWGEKKVDAEKRPIPPVHYCFERPAWKQFESNVIMLTEPRRQADHDFVRALQAVRRGDALTAMEYFGPRLNATEDPQFDGTTILGKNDEVDRFNRLRMMDLPGAEVSFPAKRSGEQLGEWKNIPEVLVLKPDALVMILVNKRVQCPGEDPMHWPILYANGDLAYFVRTVDSPIYDENMKETGKKAVAAVVRLQRNDEIVTIPYTMRQKTKQTGAAGVKAPREEVKGEINYLPLRVAYATTVHKSQGLSLDNVQVMFSNHFFTHSAMMYVALSRARSPEGLRMVGSVAQFVARCKVNEAVKSWL